MTLKYKDIIKSVGAMKCLYEKDNIPFQTAVLICNNVNCIDRALENYFSEKKTLETRFPIAPSEEGNSSPENEENYLRFLTELNEKQVEIDIVKIDPCCLSSLSFSPKHIDCISFMLNT